MTDTMSIGMSIADSFGVCYFPHESWGPRSDAAAVEVESADGGESVTIKPWYEPLYLDEHHPDALLAAYAWLPRITGSLSIVASVFIVWIVLRDRRAKLAKTRYRLLLGMSVADLFNSAAFALSSAPIPRGTYGAYGAVGTTATCTAQGFFVQLGFAEPSYSCMLAIYFVLVIQLNVAERDIRRRIEPLMHVFAVLYPLGTAVAGLPLKLFNSSGTMCYIEMYPHGCAKGGVARLDALPDWCECTRGIDAFSYQMLFAGMPLLFMLFVILGSFAAILHTVWRFNLRMRTVQARDRDRDAPRIKAAAMSTQAFLYIWAFLATYALPVTMALTEEFGGWVPTSLHLVMYTLLPLQGFWNFLAFVQPRWMVAMSLHPEMSRWGALKAAVLAREPRQFLNGTELNSSMIRYTIDNRPPPQLTRLNEGGDDGDDDDDDLRIVDAQSRRQSSALPGFYDNELATDTSFENEPTLTQCEGITTCNTIDPGDMVEESHSAMTSSVVDGRGDGLSATDSTCAHGITIQSENGSSSDNLDVFIENGERESTAAEQKRAKVCHKDELNT